MLGSPHGVPQDMVGYCIAWLQREQERLVRAGDAAAGEAAADQPSSEGGAP